MKQLLNTICLLLLLGVCCLSAFAQPITEAQAREKAFAFLRNSDSSPARKAPRKVPKLKIASSCPELFIFNDEANDGYIIVSGDERMPSVLGYSYSGQFDLDNVPDNMMAWLEGCKKETKYRQLNGLDDTGDHGFVKGEPIEPLIDCAWGGSSEPYTLKTPATKGYNASAGSYAVAMAQVMYYYKWPSKTTDIIPGYITNHFSINVPEIPITSIDWNLLRPTYGYDDNFNKASGQEVAKLMQICGAAVQTDYYNFSQKISCGDWFGKVADALYLYFGYDDNVMKIEKYKYPENIWNQIIYDELLSYRPVIYAADDSPAYSYGFVFIVDGYDKDDYFHINWGWKGVDNGYFLLSSIRWTGLQKATVGIQPSKPESPKSYAVLEDDKFTLYYDTEQATRSGEILPLIRKRPWRNSASKIKYCIIDPSFKRLNLYDLHDFFYDCKNLTRIEGLENLNTSLVCDMTRMFGDCSAITELDLNSFNTTCLHSMSSMFDGCHSLKKISLENFSASNIASFGRAFRGCSSLRKIDLSNFKTERADQMYAMFEGCSSLDSLDLSHFKTENVLDMFLMFSQCSSLRFLDISGFNTEKVTNLGGMFDGCKSLNDINLSSFNTEHVNSMYCMFNECKSLHELDLSNFNTHNVQNMTCMFRECDSLKELNLSAFHTENVEDMSNMFSYCSSLEKLYIDNFRTINANDLGGMFRGCKSLNELDLSNFDTNKVTNMEYMFNGCESLTTIYVSDIWSTDNVEKSGKMFTDCYNLAGEKGTIYNRYKYDNRDASYAHIDGGPEDPGYFTYKAIPDATRPILKNEDTKVVSILSIDGRKLSSTRPGVNILQMSDGTTRKVVTK